MPTVRPSRLESIADRVVRVTLHQLPEPIRSAARHCPIELSWMEESVTGEPELEADLLGLFEGAALTDPQPDVPELFPRIRLFLDNLWDHAEGNVEDYREEVRITLLHELGHYLGLDEDQVADLGLE